jgi:hypothetical protein
MLVAAGSASPIGARVVRHAGGVVAVTFRQDEQTLKAVDAVMGQLTGGARLAMAA